MIADLGGLGGPVLGVASAADDRQRYLMRPDLGRRLAPGADAVLAPYAGRYGAAFVRRSSLRHATALAGLVCSAAVLAGEVSAEGSLRLSGSAGYDSNATLKSSETVLPGGDDDGFFSAADPQP